MEKDEVILIESHDENGVEWIVSLDGPNPSEEFALVFQHRWQGELVKKLIWACVKTRDFNPKNQNYDFKTWCECALEGLPL